MLVQKLASKDDSPLYHIYIYIETGGRAVQIWRSVGFVLFFVCFSHHCSGQQLLVTMIGSNRSARSTSMLPNLGVLNEQFISKLRLDDRAGNSFQKLQLGKFKDDVP